LGSGSVVFRLFVAAALSVTLLAASAARGRTAGAHAAVFVLDLSDGKTTQLTRSPVDDYEPAWSPDGERLAFTRCCPGRRSLLYVADVSTGRVRLFPHTTGGCSAAWAPDGARLAFAGRGGVRVVDSDGRLISVWKGGDPSWSPDGRRIVYIIPAAGLWMKNADGTGQRYLGLPPELGASFGTSWSPNGRLIAFAATPFDAVGDEQHIYLVRPDGSHVRRLTNAGATIQDAQPSWSPDGRRLAFYRYDTSVGSGRALTLDPATGRVAALPDGAGAQHPRWSPDGKRLAFDRGGGSQPTDC
jgi:TolB protein